jgi:hypothetical protein
MVAELERWRRLAVERASWRPPAGCNLCVWYPLTGKFEVSPGCPIHRPQAWPPGYPDNEMPKPRGVPVVCAEAALVSEHLGADPYRWPGVAR